MQGKIIKGIGGFYYVHDGIGKVYECRAKGIFRNRGIKPLVGDDVEISVLDEEKATGNLDEILPRKNRLIRPAVSNVDQAVVVFAITDPMPNLNLLDRFLVMMERQEVPVSICFNKIDLVDAAEQEKLRAIYEPAGYPVHFISTYEKSGLEEFHRLIIGKTTVLAGPSGVGKSSITNFIQPEAQMETGGISEKIRRGKHTTRHSELFFVEEGTYMMDTPGFSSLYRGSGSRRRSRTFSRNLSHMRMNAVSWAVSTLASANAASRRRCRSIRSGRAGMTLPFDVSGIKREKEIRQKQPLTRNWEERTMIILSPSILGADFTKLGEQVAEVDKAGAQYIHLDVMDGAFVPSISFGMPVIKSLRPVTDRVFDVHMMVEEPGRYVEDIKKAGADLICVHQEACLHLDRTIAQIREAGLQTGVALNPATPVETLDVILPEVDMVLLMTVNPGFGGQKFIPYTVEKIKKLRAMCSERGLSTRIEVDGGITPDNVRTVLEAGADVIVAGSAVFKGNPAGNVKTFLNIFQEFEQG